MRKSSTRWLRLLLFLPVLILLPVINYLADPGSVYHDNNKEMAQYLLEGSKVAFTYNNGNEISFKKYIIEGMPEHVDCIIDGPSLSITMQDKTVGGNAINLSVSAERFYETIGQLGYLEALGKKYDRLVLCLDTFFFNKSEHDSINKNGTMMPYARYFLECLDGKMPTIPEGTETSVPWTTKIETLFSISYFQSSWNAMQINKEQFGTCFAYRNCIVDDSYEGGYYRPEDCAYVYPKEHQENTVTDVWKDAAAYSIDEIFGDQISHYSVEVLDKTIRYFLDKGVQVELWVCPLAPALWDRIDLEETPILRDIEDCVQNLGQKYPQVKVLGSYNPYNIGIKDEDFYDARHIRFEKISEYFDFT